MFIDNPTIPTQLEVLLDQLHASRQKSATPESVKTLLQPSGLPDLKESSSQSVLHMRAARELRLTTEDADGNLRLTYSVRQGKPSAKDAIISAVDRHVLSSPDLEPWFGRLYSYVISRGDSGIPSDGGSRKDLCEQFNSALPAHIERTNPLNDTKLAQYLRWFSYVGLGWRDPSKQFIPDPTDRLLRALPAIFDKSPQLEASTFMSAMALACPELDGGALFLDAAGDQYRKADRVCTGALAMALRNLHDDGVIQLDCPKDSQGWSLERAGTVRDQHMLQSDRFDRVLYVKGERK